LFKTRARPGFRATRLTFPGGACEMRAVTSRLVSPGDFGITHTPVFFVFLSGPISFAGRQVLPTAGEISRKRRVHVPGDRARTEKAFALSRGRTQKRIARTIYGLRAGRNLKICDPSAQVAQSRARTRSYGHVTFIDSYFFVKDPSGFIWTAHVRTMSHATERRRLSHEQPISSNRPVNDDVVRSLRTYRNNQPLGRLSVLIYRILITDFVFVFCFRFDFGTRVSLTTVTVSR